MSAIEDQGAAHIDQALPVQFQDLDCRSPDPGQSLDPQKITTPGEMDAPTVLPGMKQANPRTRDRLVALGLGGLAVVAEDTNRLPPEFSLVDPPIRSP
jgi:hypothetical protein